MTKLVWDVPGEHVYETGIDCGVLYIPTSGVYDTGFAWNGLTAVTESPTGAEATPQYADNIKYLNLISLEEFGATVEALTYPDEFAACDGSAAPQPGITLGQQPRQPFGLSYRTRVGTDQVSALQHGYKLHLVYGAMASPSEKAYNTINDSPEATAFSWDVWTTPVPVTGYQPTSSLVIDSTKVDATALAALEDLLYGTAGTDPSLPTPEAVLGLFDGTFAMATPGIPTYVSATDIVTIPSTTGVVYSVSGAGVVGGVEGVVPSGAYGPITANIIVKAAPAVGYYLDPATVDRWLIVFA